jgi:hypothetical protein
MVAEVRAEWLVQAAAAAAAAEFYRQRVGIATRRESSPHRRSAKP